MKPTYLTLPVFCLLSMSACSLINAFDDVVPADGSGGSGNSGGQGNAGGGGTGNGAGQGGTAGGGMGGDGGGGASTGFECIPGSNPFEVLSAADLATSSTSENILIATDPDGRLHLGVRAQQNIVLRTVRDGNDMGPVIVLADGTFNPTMLLNRMNHVAVIGDMQGNPGELRINKSGSEMSTDPPVFRPYAMDPNCVMGEAREVRIDSHAGNDYYIVKCRNNPGDVIFGGRLGMMPAQDQIDFSIVDPQELELRHFARVGNQYVFNRVSGNPTDTPYFNRIHYGTDTPSLQPGTEFSIEPGNRTFLWSIASTDTALTFFGLSLNGVDSITPAKAYLGQAADSEIATLLTSPEQFTSIAFDQSTQKDILYAGPIQPGLSNTFVSAGVEIFNTQTPSVDILWIGPDGKLRARDVVDELPDGLAQAYIAAAAGRGSALSTLVIYLVSDDANNTVTMRGRAMLCSESR